jgi:hypothetical protein
MASRYIEENLSWDAYAFYSSDDDPSLLTVKAFARGIRLDRPEVHAWTVRDETLARRMVRAIKARKVLTPVKIATDINDRTYLQTNCCVVGRTMNADLRRLGF